MATQLARASGGIILIVLLMGILTLAFNVQPVRASGTIYIRADGSVEGTTSIHTADNVTYVFTANINASLVVERDNIIIDGNGYTLQGTWEYDSKGVDLSGRTNVTTHSTTIKAFYYGIWLNYSSSNILSGNNITNNDYGMRLFFSLSNNISGNNITGNNVFGVRLDSSSGNTLSGNNFAANYGDGIDLDSSSGNALSGNNITANSGTGIYLGSSSGNTLSGNNVRANSGVGPGGVITGHGIYLYSSFNNVLSGNNVTNNCDGIALGHSYNNTLFGNNITANNGDGIYLGTSPGNTLSGNVIRGNGRNFGVYADALYGDVLSQYMQSVDTSNLVDGKPVYYFVSQSDLLVNAYAYPEVGYLAFVNCVNVTAQGLNLASNGQGLLFAFTNDSKIIGNNVTNNDVGIYFYISFNNVLSGNNVANGGDGIDLTCSNYNALSDNTVTANGGLGIWLDFSSNNTLSGNNFKANGIGIYVSYYSNYNVLSGNNFANNGNGIGLYISFDNTLSGNNVTANSGTGIWLSSSDHNTLSDNNVADSWIGILLGHEIGLSFISNPSNYNVLSGNNVTANSEGGILLDYSSGNVMSGNNVANNVATNGYGIRLYYSSNNTLSSNMMGSNQYNFGVDGSSLNDYMQSVDTSNLVDGKPVYYFVSQSDLLVNAYAYPEVGYLAFVNCVNVTAQGLNLASNGQGLLFAFTNDSKIIGSNVRNNWDGVVLGHSYNNTLFGNNVTANDGDGIYLFTSSGNALSGNNVANDNDCGVVLESSSNLNSISDNNITANNWCGIWLVSSSSNMIYHNSFIDNPQQVVSSTSMNVWDDGYPSGGNYWSDYQSKYPKAAENDSSGIWNTPYVIDTNNIDRYPLLGPTAPILWQFKPYGSSMVTIYSNSSISAFEFNATTKSISFNVTGKSATAGFCYVAVPKSLIWGTITVIKDGVLLVNGTDYVQTENSTCHLINMTYHHSIHAIEIEGTGAVPEFQPTMLLPLLMIMALLTAIVCKRKRTVEK